jgi:hypothetical protein
VALAAPRRDRHLARREPLALEAAFGIGVGEPLREVDRRHRQRRTGEHLGVGDRLARRIEHAPGELLAALELDLAGVLHLSGADLDARLHVGQVVLRGRRQQVAAGHHADEPELAFAVAVRARDRHVLERGLHPRRHLEDPDRRVGLADQQRAGRVEAFDREERGERAGQVGRAHERAGQRVAVLVEHGADDDARVGQHDVAEIDDLAGRRSARHDLVHRRVGADAGEQDVERARPDARDQERAVRGGARLAGDVVRHERRFLGEQVDALAQDDVHRAAVDTHAAVGHGLLEVRHDAAAEAGQRRHDLRVVEHVARARRHFLAMGRRHRGVARSGLTAVRLARVAGGLRAGRRRRPGLWKGSLVAREPPDGGAQRREHQDQENDDRSLHGGRFLAGGERVL